MFRLILYSPVLQIVTETQLIVCNGTRPPYDLDFEFPAIHWLIVY